jgi:hypothetical protein
MRYTVIAHNSQNNLKKCVDTEYCHAILIVLVNNWTSAINPKHRLLNEHKRIKIMATTLNKHQQHGTAHQAWRAASLVSINPINSFDGCPSLREPGYLPQFKHGRPHSAGKVL